MGIGGNAIGITIWRVVLVVVYLHAKDTTWWIALLISIVSRTAPYQQGSGCGHRGYNRLSG
jgi:hypothetical protein